MGEGSGDVGRVTKTSFLTSCKALKYTYDPPYHHHHLSWQLIGNKVSIFPLLRFVGYDRFPPPIPPENQKIPPPKFLQAPPPPPVINKDYSPEWYVLAVVDQRAFLVHKGNTPPSTKASREMEDFSWSERKILIWGRFRPLMEFAVRILV